MYILILILLVFFTSIFLGASVFQALLYGGGTFLLLIIAFYLSPRGRKVFLGYFVGRKFIEAFPRSEEQHDRGVVSGVALINGYGFNVKVSTRSSGLLLEIKNGRAKKVHIGWDDFSVVEVKGKEKSHAKLNFKSNGEALIPWRESFRSN